MDSVRRLRLAIPTNNISPRVKAPTEYLSPNRHRAVVIAEHERLAALWPDPRRDALDGAGGIISKQFGVAICRPHFMLALHARAEATKGQNSRDADSTSKTFQLTLRASFMTESTMPPGPLTSTCGCT